jgi:hypothetical protein
MKNNNEINEIIEDFIKVIQFRIITTIVNHYGDRTSDYNKALNNFKSACNDKSNLALTRFNKNFHFDSKFLQSLTRDKKGKRHLDEVLSNLDNEKLVYKHKYSHRYESGKMFNKPSTFYIPFKELECLFSLANSEQSPFKTDSGYYSKRQHKLIDKLIFRYGVKKRKEYTKSDKFIAAIEKRKELNENIKLQSLAEKAQNCDSLTEEELNELINGLEI